MKPLERYINDYVPAHGESTRLQVLVNKEDFEEFYKFCILKNISVSCGINIAIRILLDDNSTTKEV